MSLSGMFFCGFPVTYSFIWCFRVFHATNEHQRFECAWYWSINLGFVEIRNCSVCSKSGTYSGKFVHLSLRDPLKVGRGGFIQWNLNQTAELCLCCLLAKLQCGSRVLFVQRLKWACRVPNQCKKVQHQTSTWDLTLCYNLDAFIKSVYAKLPPTWGRIKQCLGLLYGIWYICQI